MTPVLQTLVAVGIPILALLTLIKRVPWIERWPGHVPAKWVDEKSVTSGADNVPTLCALTEVSCDSNKLKSEDSSVACLGKKEQRCTKPLLWKISAPGSDAGIREVQWQLITPTRKKLHEACALRHHQWPHRETRPCFQTFECRANSFQEHL